MVDRQGIDERNTKGQRLISKLQIIKNGSRGHKMQIGEAFLIFGPHCINQGKTHRGK